MSLLYRALINVRGGVIMYNMLASIELTDLVWSSDWNGDEVGYPESGVVGLYSQEREDGSYSFYIDMETGRVLDFWKKDKRSTK